MQELFNARLGTGLWREHEEILQWFGDWELLEPGLVPLPEWRPDITGQAARNSTYYGFVGGVAGNPDRGHPAANRSTPVPLASSQAPRRPATLRSPGRVPETGKLEGPYPRR